MRLLADENQHDIWLSGEYTGDQRSITRATIQRTNIYVASGWEPDLTLPRWKNQSSYPDADKQFRAAAAKGYASYFFGNPDPPRELPNIKSITWNRSVQQDAATMQMTLYNTRALPLGQLPDEADLNLDQAGHYTFNRGAADNRWNHVPNAWTNRIYPDALIKTYEGNGFDPDLPPDQDPHMTPSGVWLIDKVTFDTDAKTITIEARDMMRLLLDHDCFPMVVPLDCYPLEFTQVELADNPPIVLDSLAWEYPVYDTDSNVPYLGANGNSHGHRATDAFDRNPNSYWLSIGNGSGASDYAFEHVQGRIAAATLSKVKIHVKGGPYQVFVSAGTDTDWYGTAIVPYNRHSPVAAPNGSDIPYVTVTTVGADQEVEIDVPTGMVGVTRVRVTFHGLWDSKIGPFVYRGALREFQVCVGSVTTTSGGQRNIGNVTDFSQIIKYLASWAGFWWPDNEQDYFLDSQGGKRSYMPVLDEDLGRGALWGDIENTGTMSLTGILVNDTDKKPLSDICGQIRDIVGFLMYVDETGGLIFRSPNIFNIGNNLILPQHRLETEGSRTEDTVVLDERQTLSGLKVTMDSTNQREKIVVASVDGSLGAVANGLNPYNLPPSGLRRISIWSDALWTSQKETQIMADMISVRQMMTFRTCSVTIPGNPEVQIDDQVTIVERVSETNDLHYVGGIACTLNNDTGEWTYTLTTMWLGTTAYTVWALNPEDLSQDTQDYLRALGQI